MAGFDCDKTLLLGLCQGDKECFRQLFEAFYDRCLAFARGLLRDDMAAEDIVQDAFMKLWTRRAAIDPERSVAHFLIVIIRNAAYNHLRLRYNACRSDGPYPEMEDRSAQVDERYMLTELENRIDKIVSQMPPQRRTVFTLSRREHLSNAEIALRLNISQRTVEKHIEQALHQLRTTINVSILLLITHLF